MIDCIHPDLRSLAVPIEQLNEDPKNANSHTDCGLAAIAESFKRFGQRKPIVVRREGMIVEAGNGTLASLRAAGWTHLACIVCDDDEQTATAFALVDNQAGRLSHWNFDALRERVDELVQGGYDVQGLGWKADELADILAGKAQALQEQLSSEPPKDDAPSEPPSKPAKDDDDTDEVPEPPPEPITKPGDVVQIGRHVLHCADCMDVMRSLPDNSIDAIVTDPPYGLSPDGRARTWDDIERLRAEGKGPRAGFMGNAWDAGVPGVTWARECLRVLKPGGHMIAHSATRTVHRLACAIEDAGFEIRDQIGWLHWQGFPKSHNVSLAIDEALGGVRTEERGRRQVPDASVTRPHFAGMAGDASASREYIETAPATDEAKQWDGWGTALKPACEPAVLARKPLSEPTVAANVLRWGTGALNLDACRYAPGDAAWPGPDDGENAKWPANIYACPKPSGRERGEGTETLPQQLAGAVASDDPVSARFLSQPTGNTHPTVKPIKLYRWLLRLVTPPGGRVFESFGGSGTTLVAAEREGFSVIAAEREPQYCDIIRARVEAAKS